MDHFQDHEIDKLEAAHKRLFEPFMDINDDDSLAQPFPQRYVQSITTDHVLIEPASRKRLRAAF